VHAAWQSAIGSCTSHFFLQLTLHAPSQLASHVVLSWLESQPAVQRPSQSALQLTLQSNLPGSTVQSPMHPASHSPLHDTLGSLLQSASHCAARRALHVARTVCRRAERRVVELGAETEIPPLVVIYLNRLSDLLFTLARVANKRSGTGEVTW
jgi:hypothetical protein